MWVKSMGRTERVSAPRFSICSRWRFRPGRAREPELSPRTIAAAHHISMPYLYKLFEEQGHNAGQLDSTATSGALSAGTVGPSIAAPAGELHRSPMGILESGTVQPDIPPGVRRRSAGCSGTRARSRLDLPVRRPRSSADRLLGQLLWSRARTTLGRAATTSS